MIGKFGRVAWSLIEIVIIVYVIVVTSFILCKNKFGYIQYGDYTLVPLKQIHVEALNDFKKGDLLVINKDGFTKVGDVVYFYYPSPNGDMYLLKSGKIKEITSGSSLSLYSFDDSGLPVISSTKILGKNVKIYSSLGTIISILINKVGFLLLVLLPIMIIFVYQIYEFIVILKFDVD